jgi:hypothetical protein
MKGKTGEGATSARVLFRKESERGTPARELEPTATHRLGLNIGWQGKSTRKVTKKYCCWATKKDKLWLGHSAQLSLAPTWR